MPNINDEINNLNLEEIKLAVEQQNNGVLNNMYLMIVEQQELIIALNNRVESLEKNRESFLKIIEKLVAKIEVLNQFVKKISGDIEIDNIVKNL